MPQLSTIVAFVLLTLSGPALAGEPADDPVASTWKARAALAKERLAGKKLDACDRGLEEAFLNAQLETTKGERQYAVAIRIDGKVLIVLYWYEGKKLDDFSMAGLPEGWFAHQKANSKTLSILLSVGSKCAFDLCTAGPTPDGTCESAKP